MLTRHHRGFNDWSGLLNEEFKLFIVDCWRRTPCRVGPLTLIGTGILPTVVLFEGELRYRKWQAFKQMLKDLSPMKRIEDLPSIQLWDHFLVYAISLGVAEHVIKVLKN